MQAILSNPNTILWAMITAVILLTVCVILLIERADRRDKAVGTRLDDVEKTLGEQLSLTREQVGEQSKTDREEMSTNMRGMGDSVTRVMSEMARTQQSQLDAFSGQLRDMGRVDEERMNEMRRSVEERLAAYEARMDRIGDVIDDKMDRNEQRLERMRESVEQRINTMQVSNDRHLEQMQVTVDERLNATLDKRLGERFQLVSERLEQVYKGLSEIETLASGVGDLKKVLTGVKSQGMMGEIQLGALLSQMLTSEQYEENVVLRKNGAAVDYAVKLPSGKDGAQVYLPIDARFPHEAYYRLMDAQESGDQAAIERMGEELTQKMLLAGQRIGEEFVAPPNTTDFAVLFLASEGLYAEVLRRGDLVQQLQRDCHVMLTGPNTLAALLGSLQMGFKTMAIEKRSEEVWALLGAVRGEFAHFAEALARTQKRIRQAGESIEDASRKSRAIQRKLKRVEEMDAASRAQLLQGDDDDDDDFYDDGDWD